MHWITCNKWIWQCWISAKLSMRWSLTNTLQPDWLLQHPLSHKGVGLQLLSWPPSTGSHRSECYQLINNSCQVFPKAVLLGQYSFRYTWMTLLITSIAASDSLQMISFCIELSQLMMTTILSRLILTNSTNGHWTGKWHLMSRHVSPCQ